MDINKVPIIGKINKTLTTIMVNFILLAVIALILGIVIPFFPRVLDILVGAFLIVAAVIFLNIAYNLHQYKKKMTKWFDR